MILIIATAAAKSLRTKTYAKNVGDERWNKKQEFIAKTAKDFMQQKKMYMIVHVLCGNQNKKIP